jgi:hypothetical protein
MNEAHHRLSVQHIWIFVAMVCLGFMFLVPTVNAQEEERKGCYCEATDEAAGRSLGIQKIGVLNKPDICFGDKLLEDGRAVVDCKWFGPIPGQDAGGDDGEEGFALPSGIQELDAFVTTGQSGTARARSAMGRLLKFLTGILGTFALLILVYAGVLWMTAGGNAEREKKAMEIMFWGVLGLFTMLASYSVVGFIIRNTF